MAWRMARSLEVLLAEINAAHPKRSKAADGGIGDAAHASRTSDHNPWITNDGVGVVTARDFTNDPADGFDSSDFAEWLRQRCKADKETRVKYIISDRRICNGDVEDWKWREYTGSNPHEHHVHVSVKSTESQYDKTTSWGYPDKAKEDDMEWTDKIKLTAADARVWNEWGDTNEYKEGTEVSVSEMLRYPTLAKRLEIKLDRVLAALAKK